MNNLKFAFLGSTKYSEALLFELINKGFIPSIIFAIPKEFSISYSSEKVVNYNYANLESIAKENGIEYYEISEASKTEMQKYSSRIQKLDLLLVLGWYYMIPKSIRELTKHGAWGIHASLLPSYSGGAPLNWAIINGENSTGVTLFRFEDGVDNGDIIAQKEFSIEYEDTIKDVYKKATQASKEILISTLNDIQNVTFKKQDEEQRTIFPQRKPEDGEIDLDKTANEIYNFIRAQSSPYPGAFIKTVDGKKIVIEKARVE